MSERSKKIENLQSHLLKIEMAASGAWRSTLIHGYNKEVMVETMNKIRAHLTAMGKDL